MIERPIGEHGIWLGHQPRPIVVDPNWEHLVARRIDRTCDRPRRLNRYLVLARAPTVDQRDAQAAARHYALTKVGRMLPIGPPRNPTKCETLAKAETPPCFKIATTTGT